MSFPLPRLLAKLPLRSASNLAPLAVAVRPYKSLSLYRQYFTVSSGIINRTNHQARVGLFLLYTLLLYFLLLNLLFIIVPISPYLRWVFYDSAAIVLQRNDRTFNRFYILQTAMTIFYYYLLYQGNNQAINEVMKELFTETPRPKTAGEHLAVIRAFSRRRQMAEEAMPTIAWTLLNALQPFVGLIGLNALMVVAQLEVGLFTEYGRVFTGSLIAFLAILSHIAHLLLTLIFWYAFAHICILSAAYISTIMVYLYLKCRQLKSLLKPASIDGYLTGSVSLYRLIFAADEHYRSIFLVFCIVNMPFSAFLSMKLLLGQVVGQEKLILFSLDFQEILAIFLLHLLIAQFSKRTQRLGKQLLGFYGRTATSRGKGIRGKLRLNLHISRLFTNRPYGITYGGLAVVCLATFTKCLMLYGKFLMYSFKILKH